MTKAEKNTDADDDGRIHVKRQGHVMLIGIDRVAKLNGFTLSMLNDLAEAFTAMETDKNIRCGVLYSVGAHFTAGVQLDQVGHLFAEGKHLFPAGKVDPVNLNQPTRTKPLVIAVQGICFTLGIELMLAGDIVIAASDCRFSQLEVKRGIFANHGATLQMVERAGLGNALRYLLTGEEFDANTAKELGFVQEVVDSGTQIDRAIELAEVIAAQAPLAVAATLKSARTAFFASQEAAIKDLQPMQAELMASADAAEGVLSFIEKRSGRFTGH